MKIPLMKKMLLSLALLICVPVFGQGEQETGLDRYVKAPDPAYKWSLVKTIPGDGVTAYVLDMTSQAWLTANEVDRPEWKHWVIVYKPETLKHSTALLMIGGSSNDSPGPAKHDQFFAQTSRKTSSVTIELRMVPNQPLSFFGESRKRTEDAIIAMNWMKHMETGDDKWATRLPMTKAAVRAMDAASEFLKSDAGGGVTVDKFVVTGGSKRGWTTWTTGIVDKRVVAIMPVVIDLLNVVPSFMHHWRAYGFWAPAVGDYVEHGVMDKFNTPEFARLMKLVEPYEYRGRLTMPKFMVNSAGDQFFLPDSWQFYWNDLKGEKYLRYVPNSDHGVTRRTDAGDSLAAYYASIINNWKRPEFDWSIDKEGTITVKSQVKPLAVKLWQANNPDARDFRLEKIGPAYKSTDLAETAPNTWVVKAPAVEKGFTAYFVELTYQAPEQMLWKFTTGVKVMPDVYPFPAPQAVNAAK